MLVTYLMKRRRSWADINYLKSTNNKGWQLSYDRQNRSSHEGSFEKTQLSLLSPPRCPVVTSPVTLACYYGHRLRIYGNILSSSDLPTHAAAGVHGHKKKQPS